MYINFEYLNKKWIDNSLSYIDFLLLVAINQKELEHFRYEDEVLGERLNNLEVRGYIEPFKTTKGYKVTKKGKTILRDADVADVSEEGNRLYADLMEMYLSLVGKDKLGNKKNGLRMMMQFVKHTDFSREEVLEAVESYIHSKNGEYRPARLDYLIFYSKNVYSQKFDLAHSHLYTLVSNNRNANN